MAYEIGYNREAAIAYASEWAFSRNPAWYAFDEFGGDCTNFISQCVFAGCGVMNYTRDFGWYYISPSNRAAAWTGVPYFYNFMTNNQGRGPHGYEADLAEAELGDVVQLNFNGERYAHSLLVVEIGEVPDPSNILIATHTIDSYLRPLDTYTYQFSRLIKIAGARE